MGRRLEILPLHLRAHTFKVQPLLSSPLPQRYRFIPTDRTFARCYRWTFSTRPFPAPLQTSPLQTVPRDECKRRVVLDLSFPVGSSVNDGIPKDSFLDEPFHLPLPRSANFVDLIVAKAPGCYLFKKNLKRTYRQIPVDPKDYIFLGYRWKDLLYFDLVLPFGLRSATLACQRTTNAIAYIFTPRIITSA